MLSSASLSIVTLTFSLTVLSVQIAAQSYSPRLLDDFIKDPIPKIVIAINIGAYAYCYVMSFYLHDHNDRVAPIAVHFISFHFALVLISFVSFIHVFIDGFRVENILHRAAEATMAAGERLNDNTVRGQLEPNVPKTVSPYKVLSRKSGYITAYRMEQIIRLVTDLDLCIRYHRQIGDFVNEGTLLCYLWDAKTKRDEATTDQDENAGGKDNMDDQNNDGTKKDKQSKKENDTKKTKKNDKITKPNNHCLFRDRIMAEERLRHSSSSGGLSSSGRGGNGSGTTRRTLDYLIGRKARQELNKKQPDDKNDKNDEEAPATKGKIPLLRNGPDPELQARLSLIAEKGVRISEQRTTERDVTLGLQQIADIAVRALSPGVNDPHTAIQCMDVLSSVLSRLSEVHGLTAFPHVCDDNGVIRVFGPRPSFVYMLSLLDGIRRYGNTDVSVCIRGLRLFGDLTVILTRADRFDLIPSTLAQMELWMKAARKTFDDNSPELRSIEQLYDSIVQTIVESDKLQHDKDFVKVYQDIVDRIQCDGVTSAADVKRERDKRSARKLVHPRASPTPFESFSESIAESNDDEAKRMETDEGKD